MMATYSEGKRASDAYRSDSSPKGLNDRDKGGLGKAGKISTKSLKKFDNQKSGKC